MRLIESTPLRSTTPVVSVLLPSWNTKEHTLGFLRTVATQRYPLEAVEIIIVDNGSNDGSPAALERWLGSSEAAQLARAVLVAWPANCGIAAAYNAALENCSPSAWAVIRAESDVIWGAGVVSTLAGLLRAHSSAGVIGVRGCLFEQPSEAEHAARYVNWWTGTVRSKDPEHLVRCDCVFGGTFIVRRECFDRLGFFYRSDRFFADELAVCTRIRRLGYDILYTPEVRVLHKVARSTSQLRAERFRYVDAFERALMHLELNRWPSRWTALGFSVVWAVRRRDGLMLRALWDAMAFTFWLRQPVPGMAVTGSDWAAWMG
jgi:GT2 family glycosyltransferase